MRRKLIDLQQQRTAVLEKAEGLLKEGKREEYRAEMAKVSGMNAEIKDLQDLIQEQDRKFMEKAARRSGTRPWSGRRSCRRAARSSSPPGRPSGTCTRPASR